MVCIGIWIERESLYAVHGMVLLVLLVDRSRCACYEWLATRVCKKGEARIGAWLCEWSARLNASGRMMLAVLPMYLIHLSKRSRYSTDDRSDQETAQYAPNASNAAFQKQTAPERPPPSNVDLDPQSPLQKAGLSRKGPPKLTQPNPAQGPRISSSLSDPSNPSR